MKHLVAGGSSMGSRPAVEDFIKSKKAGSYRLHDALQTVREDAAGYD